MRCHGNGNKYPFEHTRVNGHTSFIFIFIFWLWDGREMRHASEAWPHPFLSEIDGGTRFRVEIGESHLCPQGFNGVSSGEPFSAFYE